MSSQSRHVYTREERVLLETSFTRQSHPDIHEKERLAKLLNCNIIQISNWFQNHRRRIKKQQKSSSITTINSSPSYPVIYYCQQPNCSCNYNNHSSSYYYYSSPYVYSQESIYTQPMFVNTQVDYQQ